MTNAPEYLIRKSGFYYRPNCRGYTISAIFAGRYSKEQAEKETHPNGPDGPRDGMSFIHVSDVTDQDFIAYQAAIAAAYERAADLCVEQFQAHLDLVITGNPDNARNRESASNMAEKLSHEIRALATDTQTDALELVRVEERNDTLKRVNGYCTDCETAAIVNSDGRCASCGSGRTWPLREPAKQALEAEKEKAERVGYERGVREAARHAASATGDVDLMNSILALLDNPTPDPDEPTKAAQELPFRKAVSS